MTTKLEAQDGEEEVDDGGETKHHFGRASEQDGDYRALPLHKNLKYEKIYRESYQDPVQAAEEVGKYIDWYNQKRIHRFPFTVRWVKEPYSA